MTSRAAPDDFPAIALPHGRAFEAIHQFYLLIEPDLIASIQRADICEARRLINHVLVHIYSIGEERSDFLKFLLLEFVVILSRRAIEAGGDSDSILKFGFSATQELASALDDEILAKWLRETLEGLMAAFPKEASLPRAVERALDYMRRHVDSRLSRESVASAVGVSDAHLNELLKRSTGRSFRALVRSARVERASEMLSDPRVELAEIAVACGFCDQSHLTRVFRGERGVTPREYRARLGGLR